MINLRQNIEKIRLFIFQAMLLSLPFHRILFTYLALLFFIVFFLYPNFSNLKNNWKKWHWIIGLNTAYFFTLLIGMLYTEDKILGWNNLETKLALLVTPIVAFLGLQLNKQQIEKSLVYFVYSLAIALIICLITAVFRYYESGDVYEFYYGNLSLFKHPGYFAMYLNFGFVLSIQAAANYAFGRKWLLIALSLFFCFGILLLNSRTAIIVLLLLIPINLWALVKSGFSIRNTIFMLLLLVGGILYFSTQAKPVANRIKHAQIELKESLGNDNKKLSNSGVRLFIWKESLNVFKENLFFGVGTGDVRSELLIRYNTNEINVAAEKNYNAHNQFLQAAMATGIFGLIALLMMVMVPLYLGIKHNLLLLIAFYSITFMSFFTESMLERQDGVMYFAVFNVILWFYFKNNQINQSNDSIFTPSR